MANGKLQKQMRAYSTKSNDGAPRELKNNIWEDVSVQIGRIYRSEAAKITMEDFRDWLQVSLDLESPKRSIKTSHGDLILDAEFSSRIYLKNLLLESNSSGK